MDRLPSELLLMIFRRIDDFREMLKLELVCRRWRQIMKDHGWKYLRRVANGRSRRRRNQNRRGLAKTLSPLKWVVPIGERCGNNLVDCSLYKVVIDSNLMRLIARNLPALRHLKFHSCHLLKMKANVLDPFRQFCARLRSLTFFEGLSFPEYYPHLVHNLLRHFPRLRHIGLDFFHRSDYDANDICRHFSTHLHSFYLNCFDYQLSDLEQMLARVRTDSPGLMALYLNAGLRNSDLSQISELTNLRFLHMNYIKKPHLLSSCLANLPHLLALQICSKPQHLPDVFRSSSSFRALVHLRLSLFADHSNNYELIGLLSTVAPQLRSLSLNIIYDEKDDDELPSKQDPYIVCQLLKTAHNGNLEHLHVPGTSFTISDINQLVRLCPILHSFCARMSSPIAIGPMSEIVELRRVVADQWHAGTRKQLPLQIWLRGGHGQSAAVWQDPFLIVRHVDYSFAPLDPVLVQLFREEVFSGTDDGGMPSFVTECSSESHSDCYAQNVPKKDLVIF